MEKNTAAHQMDWEALATYYDHWQDGGEAIQQELLRVAQLSLAGGRANAALALEDMNSRLQRAKGSPGIYLNTLDDVLQAHIALMEAKSNRNPFMDLDAQLAPETLAHRFALAYLSGTTPEKALHWLRQVDRLEERVQYLVDGVCQLLVRLSLIKERKVALAAVLEEEKALTATWPIDNASSVDQPSDRKEELAASNSTSQVPEAEEGITGSAVKEDIATTEDIKAGSKKVLMHRTHGFPWDKGPASTATAKIHAFLVEGKIIDAKETPAVVVGSLFSKTGPAAPIRLLKGPARLIHMFRWLSINDILLVEDELGLEDYSEAELRRFGRWLYPRFIGTFRSSDGKRFTKKQLNNAVNRMKYEQLVHEKWYSDMVAVMERSRNII
ncbi:hypothetical protein H7F15_16090 [Pontibacter sp. Tf4]|uniref:hypothetical protein n=1 Tax=Pontibacter sp. Tf4 TaxID=2761620 RepID=UPI001628A1A0|nr:hypothetical protein [Pontibacter sp. Tf4]MBB6612565.1 hypothetical protein [Pontibacter sp. Tf4]